MLVLTGCSTARHDVPLVPWDDTVMAAPSPAAAPCQAARLAATGFQFTATASGGTGAASLRNTGPDACRLSGRPGVEVVGAVPAPSQRQLPLPADTPEFPTVVPPDSALSAVPPGGSVTVSVDWRNWCVPAGAPAPVPPRAIRLTLPDGGGAVEVPYNAVPPCETPGDPSTLGVRPFQPAPLPSSPPWTVTGLRATIQPLTGNAGLTGTRGGTVRFAVLLQNPSSAPVPFDHCPLVVEMLAPAGRPEAHQLNCRAAGVLPAGGALRFEMRVPVPADAPDGANGLFWELDPTGSQGPQVTARVTVHP